jgi:hypothetical protein
MLKGQVQFKFEDGGKVTGVEDFLAGIKKFVGNKAEEVFFRGQGDPAGELIPSVARKQHYAGQAIVFTEKQEQDLLRRFQRHAYQHFQRVPTEWEALFLARHHGMPTRLLDWTSNPLVSLYFAAVHQSEELVYQETADGTASEKLNVDGTVWAIAARPERHDLDVLLDRRSPLDIKGLKLVHPFYPSPRMIAQSGIFTLHGDPWTDLVQMAGKPYPETDLDICRLMRWSVCSRMKTQIILDLERLAINSRTLFPDLDGLVKGLWQTEVLRQIHGQ